MDSIYAQRNVENTDRYSNITAFDNESIQDTINQTRSSLEAVTSGKLCNCVNFRFDDVQDYWLQGAQLSALDHFLSRNFPLTLGIIMGGTAEDLKIIDKVRQGNQKGVFELAIHGWNHTDYTKLDETQQKVSLKDSNTKMRELFGNYSSIFIPPQSHFNNDTIKAMRNSNLSILSSDIPSEIRYDQGKSILSLNYNSSYTREFTRLQGNGSNNFTRPSEAVVYHIPANVLFSIEDSQGRWLMKSIQNILIESQNMISKYGYAVIVLHPQDFARVDSSGKVIDRTVDYSKLDRLSQLTDLLSANNIPVMTLEEIRGSFARR